MTWVLALSLASAQELPPDPLDRVRTEVPRCADWDGARGAPSLESEITGGFPEGKARLTRGWPRWTNLAREALDRGGSVCVEVRLEGQDRGTGKDSGIAYERGRTIARALADAGLPPDRFLVVVRPEVRPVGHALDIWTFAPGAPPAAPPPAAPAPPVGSSPFCAALTALWRAAPADFEGACGAPHPDNASAFATRPPIPGAVEGWIYRRFDPLSLAVVSHATVTMARRVGSRDAVRPVFESTVAAVDGCDLHLTATDGHTDGAEYRLYFPLDGSEGLADWMIAVKVEDRPNWDEAHGAHTLGVVTLEVLPQ